MRIVPAILTSSDGDLEKMVKQAELFTDYVQIDFMDGEFVPSVSIKPRALNKISTSLKLEVHLMVKKPQDFLDELVTPQLRKVVFHCEATNSPTSTINHIRSRQLEVGLAINPETDVSKITGLVNQIDSVLLLTVNPGFYGSKFIPKVLDKVEQLRAVKTSHNLKIGIDGGVKLTNFSSVITAGIDFACVGSAIFNQTNPSRSYYQFIKLLEEEEKCLN
jgi:ribulose-phosphate 3-epimerase